ncbi:hypothetical protein H2203_006419 [Taxawa tesnikishii (nom. ined.)]|nr:hypothetical protein H2203_006419 [Dothideales sp. JES 119]
MSSADPELKKNMYLFNCAQRAHANYLENHSSVIAAMLIGGIRYPVVTTLMGLGWSVSRVVYALGYTAKDKENGKGRLAGSPMWLFQFGLFIMTGVTGYKLAF